MAKIIDAKKKQVTFFVFLVSGLWSLVSVPASRADMIETKKEGIMNGKVVSESVSEVNFKDAGGNTHLVQKKDVLYMEKEEEKTTVQKIKDKAADVLTKAKEVREAIMGRSEYLTKKYIGAAGAPLDRSKANAKADKLSHLMDEASLASVSMAKKNMDANREMRRQSDDRATSKLDADESKKGRFAAL